MLIKVFSLPTATFSSTLKIPHTGDTDSVDVCGKQHYVTQIYKKCGSLLEHLPVCNALCGDNPEQNAGTIHESNPEDLHVFKAPSGDNPKQNAGTIHASNPEHLLFFKATCGDDPEENSGNWSCDLRANERSQNKLHWEGTTLNIQHSTFNTRTSRLLY